jgi:methylmalonyl-CoA/ethylmalonyl-CoA epimerase
MINGLSHISIAVPNLEAAARELNAKYGLEVGAPMVNVEQGVRLAYVELGNGKIELMEPSRPDSPVAKFLERNPKGGIHHLCFGVEDVETAARAFAQNGVRVLGEGRPQRNVAGAAIAFIHPGDFLGALVELEQHKA